MIDITTLYDNVEKYAITLENSEYACGNLSKSYDFATRMIEHCDYTLEKQREKIREMLDDIEYINTFKNHNKRNVFQEIWYQKEIYNLFWNMSDSIDDQLEREKKHGTYLERILNILENDKKLIIKEIGIRQLESLIQKSTQNLTHYKIPRLNMRDLFAISTTSTTIKEKILILTINIPIVENECSTLYEILPVPVHVGNQTIILNRNAIYYMIDHNETRQIKIIPKKHIEECRHLEQQSFCNSLTSLAIYRGDECWNSIIFNANASICQYKTIPNDNYFIPLGKNGTFLYVIQPTYVRMVCNNLTTFHNITDHKIISFENNCDIFHAMDFDPTTYFENTTTKIQLTKPGFSAKSDGNWHQLLEIDSQHIESEKEIIQKTTKNVKKRRKNGRFLSITLQKSMVILGHHSLYRIRINNNNWMPVLKCRMGNDGQNKKNFQKGLMVTLLYSYTFIPLRLITQIQNFTRVQ